MWRQLTPEDRRKAYKIIEAADNYALNHPIECYSPLDHQKKFHNAKKDGKPYRVRMFSGGNQSGKTYAGSMEIGMHFSLNYPDWYEGHRFTGPVAICIMVKNFPNGVGEIMEPALARSIPQRLIRKIKRNSQGFITKITGINGSTITMTTHDMDTKALEGSQYDILWGDEPPPRDKYIALQRGLMRRKGITILTCTPLDEPWIYDDIYLNPEHFSITVSIDDNEHISDEAREDFIAMLNEDEIEARRYGKFMHLSGLVYKEFGQEHIVDTLPPELKDWPKWHVVDPHNRRPFAFIYFAVDPQENIWIYDEWPKDKFHTMKTSSRSPQDYANLFREMENGTSIHRRIMDGRFCKQPQGAGGDSLLEIFDELNIHFEPSYITTTLGVTDPGHLKIKEYLRISPLTGRPSLFVHRNCTNVIYAFQHNTWDNSKTEGVVKERPKEFAKDFLDCIRYGIMDDVCYNINNTNTQDRFWANENSGTYGAITDY